MRLLLVLLVACAGFVGCEKKADYPTDTLPAYTSPDSKAPSAPSKP